MYCILSALQTGSHVTFDDVTIMSGRLVVVCAAVELLVVVVVKSASFQSADVITARRQLQQPCVSGSSGEMCLVHTSRQATSASSSASRRRHRRRRQTASSDSMSRRLDEDKQKRRAQQKSQTPKQNVTVEDKSVAEALALAANVGRGPPPPPVPLKPTTAQSSKASSIVKPPVSNISSSSSKETGSADAVNVMLALGCEAEPCQHGGACFTDAFSPRGFSCRCAVGYYGDVCEYGRYTVVSCGVDTHAIRANTLPPTLAISLQNVLSLSFHQRKPLHCVWFRHSSVIRFRDIII